MDTNEARRELGHCSSGHSSTVAYMALDALDRERARVEGLKSKLAIHEGGLRADALKALIEQPGLKTRVVELEDEAERVRGAAILPANASTGELIEQLTSAASRREGRVKP